MTRGETPEGIATDGQHSKLEGRGTVREFRKQGQDGFEVADHARFQNAN